MRRRWPSRSIIQSMPSSGSRVRPSRRAPAQVGVPAVCHAGSIPGLGSPKASRPYSAGVHTIHRGPDLAMIGLRSAGQIS